MREMDEIERIKRIEDFNTVFFPSKFNFLNEHKGLRPGEMHMIMSTSGAGKSSLVRSIMIDLAKNNKILLWLSEESEKSFYDYVAINGIPNGHVKNIHLHSEVDDVSLDDTGRHGVIKRLQEKINEVRPAVVIFDNITTSQAYEDLKISEQVATVTTLKRMSNRTGLPFLLIAHTKGEINMFNQGLISGNDIRGTKGVINKLEYLYVFQKLSIANSYFNFIRIEKHRTQPVDKTFFALEYSVKTGGYVQDWAIDFDILKENYAQRNLLK